MRALELVLACASVRADVVISLPSGAHAINIVGASYASVNLDPSCNRGFHTTNYSNPNLVAAAAGLQPAVLR